MFLGKALSIWYTSIKSCKLHSPLRIDEPRDPLHLPEGCRQSHWRSKALIRCDPSAVQNCGPLHFRVDSHEELGQKAETSVQKSQARPVSGRHKSCSEKWRSKVLAASFRNTSGSQTHCRRARLSSLGERHSVAPCDTSSSPGDLLA
jgi:hypothetical protein